MYDLMHMIVLQGQKLVHYSEMMLKSQHLLGSSTWLGVPFPLRDELACPLYLYVNLFDKIACGSKGGKKNLDF